jgi:hypothetical protein
MDLNVNDHWTRPDFGSNATHHLYRLVKCRNRTCGCGWALGTSTVPDTTCTAASFCRLDGVRFLDEDLLPKGARIKDRNVGDVDMWSGDTGCSGDALLMLLNRCVLL